MARHELVLLLRDEIAGRVHCGVHTVILIDDLHRAQSDMESFLRLLTALNAGSSNAGSRGKADGDRGIGSATHQRSVTRITAADSTDSAEFG